MKQNTWFLIIATLVLVAGLAAAGCTQGSTDASSPSTGSPLQGSADGSVAAGPGTGGQYSGNPGNAAGGNAGHRDRGQGGFFNETRMTAAAAKLGVSPDTLATALNSSVNSTNGRPDMTAAAQKLGVTQQQLVDALGFTGGVGTPYNGTRTRGAWNVTAGQAPGGQYGQQPLQGQNQ